MIALAWPFVALCFVAVCWRAVSFGVAAVQLRNGILFGSVAAHEETLKIAAERAAETETRLLAVESKLVALSNRLGAPK